jgi:hypothetical protein
MFKVVSSFHIFLLTNCMYFSYTSRMPGPPHRPSGSNSHCKKQAKDFPHAERKQYHSWTPCYDVTQSLSPYTPIPLHGVLHQPSCPGHASRIQSRPTRNLESGNWNCCLIYGWRGSCVQRFLYRELPTQPLQ